MDRTGTVVRVYSDGTQTVVTEVEEKVDIELPSATAQAKNLSAAFVEHAKAYFKSAPKEVQEERWATCLGCELLTEEKRCSVCGCFMAVKTKWIEQKCPINKW